MASLYFTQFRRKCGLTTAGLHVYRSYYDRSSKRVIKVRLGVVPMTGAGLPLELVGRLSVDELLEVRTKLRTVATEIAEQLRARAFLIEQGQRP